MVYAGGTFIRCLLLSLCTISSGHVILSFLGTYLYGSGEDDPTPQVMGMGGYELGRANQGTISATLQ